MQERLRLCLGELLVLVLQGAGGKALRKIVQVMGKRVHDLGLAQEWCVCLQNSREQPLGLLLGHSSCDGHLVTSACRKCGCALWEDSDLLLFL